MNDRLGIITEGTLTKGLTAHLDAAYSVEDVRVGQFVKIQGDKFDFFCLVTDVMLGAASPDVLMDPPDDEFMTEVLAGTSIYGSISLQPMLMLGKAPIEEALPDELGKPLPVRTIPVHFARVDVATRPDFERVFAEPGEASWEVGTPRDMDIPILLDLERIA